MIEWLQNFSGIKNSGMNMEKIELESLRKEMAKYKKKYEKEDEEMKVDSDESVKPYFKIKIIFLILKFKKITYFRKKRKMIKLKK